MQKGWQIGSIFGIPIYIDQSWIFIIILFTLSNAQEFKYRLPDASLPVIWGSGLAVALLLFLSVFLHELGHSVVALSQGIKVNYITLYMFGGVAAIERDPKTPGHVFQVAIAGPLVSLALFFLFGAGLKIPLDKTLLWILKDVSEINLVLAIFNMIPGLPLDGGQVLKSLVWKVTGNQFTGVRVAAKCGLILGGLFIAYGLYGLITTNNLTYIWTAFIGGFIANNAMRYEQLNKLQESLSQIKAENVMTQDFRVVDANMNIREFADKYIITESWQNNPLMVYYAVSNGRYRGLVSVEDLKCIDRGEWGTKTVYDIVHSLDTIVTVQEKTSLVEIINALENNQIQRITVLSPAETISGVIDKGDIVKSLANKMGWNVPDTEINRIKSEGTYPDYLQLHLMAKNLG